MDIKTLKGPIAVILLAVLSIAGAVVSLTDSEKDDVVVENIDEVARPLLEQLAAPDAE